MEHVEPIRVVIIDLPRLLRDIVCRTVGAEPDMHVVCTDDGDSIAEAVQRDAATVVVVAADHPAVAGDVPDILRRRADLRVLAVAADGAEARLYDLRPRRVGLGELSPDTLLGAIRAPVPAVETSTPPS